MTCVPCRRVALGWGRNSPASRSLCPRSRSRPRVCSIGIQGRWRKHHEVSLLQLDSRVEINPKGGVSIPTSTLEERDEDEHLFDLSASGAGECLRRPRAKQPPRPDGRWRGVWL